jgi:hypothetical protein
MLTRGGLAGISLPTDKGRGRISPRAPVFVFARLAGAGPHNRIDR